MAALRNAPRCLTQYILETLEEKKGSVSSRYTELK